VAEDDPSFASSVILRIESLGYFRRRSGHGNDALLKLKANPGIECFSPTLSCPAA